MRTTLDIDDDILLAVKSIAEARDTSAGKVISELARKSLEPPSGSGKKNGFTLFPTQKKGKTVTMEMVNRLRDEDP